jgi:hypothetical protein
VGIPFLALLPVKNVSLASIITNQPINARLALWESSRPPEKAASRDAITATPVSSATFRTVLVFAPLALPAPFPTQLKLPASFAPPANFLALPPLTALIASLGNIATLMALRSA